MATYPPSSTYLTEEESQNSASPKPRLTRIRSLLSSQSNSLDRDAVISRDQLRNTVTSRDQLREALLSRDLHSDIVNACSNLASQSLSQEVASLSRQPTLELLDMRDLAEKPTLEKRRSSRLLKEPSGASASLTVDDICAPDPVPAMSRSSSKSMSRSTSKRASMSRSSSKSMSRSISKRTSMSRSSSKCMSRSTSKILKTASFNFSDDVEKSSEESDDHELMGKDTEEAEKESDEPMDLDEAEKDSEAEKEAESSSSSSPATPIPGPSDDPFGPSPIELMISFDTTGSMSSCIAEVRKCVQDLVQRLFMDIPNLKISIVAHGDYCDERTYYVLKHVDFTNDPTALCEFVRDVGPSGGGDFEECYEYVLYHARQTKWTPGTQRALVMIGDATPHEPNYHLNKLKLDWREEANKLNDELGVRIYAVQCQNNGAKTEQFYKSLANRTQGWYLKLNKFSTIVDILMAICYREKGAEFFDVSIHDRSVTLS